MKRYENKLRKDHYKCITSRNRNGFYYYLKDVSLLEINEGDLFIPIKDCIGVGGRLFSKECDIKLEQYKSNYVLKEKIYNRNEKLNKLLNEN